MIQLARNINSHFQAFKVLVGINIRTTVLSTRLGWFWWILDPLIMMAIYYFLIKGIFGRGGEDYHIFVLSGIIIWQFFTKTVNATLGVISGNKQVIRQISFPLPVLVAIPVVTNLFFAVVGMVIVVLFNYSNIGLHTVAILPLLIVVSLLSYGIGLFVSVISVFLADIRKFISYLLRAGFFISPVLYPASRLMESPSIPEQIKIILSYNPMMWIIPAARNVVLKCEVYDWGEFILHFIFVLLLVKIGLVWMRRNSSKIIKML